MKTGNSSKEQLWNAGFIELILLGFLNSFSFSCIHSLVSSYAVGLGVELTAAGTAVGMFSIAAMVIRPFSGFFTDNFNKKKLLFFTTMVLGISLGLYCFCNSIWFLLVLRIIHGMAFGVNSTVNMALAVEYIPKSRTSEGLGFFGVGQVIAQVVGPTFGVSVKNASGYTFLFLSSGIFVAIGAVLFYLVFHYEPAPAAKKQQPDQAGTSQSAVSNLLQRLIAKECIFYALIAGLFSMSNGIVSSLLVPLGESRNVGNIALFFTVNAGILFVLRITIGKYLDRASLLWVVVVSLLTGALSMVMLGASYALPMILLSGAIKAIGNVGGQIALQSACVRKVDKSRVGVASSTYYIGADLGNGFGPIWSGKVAELSGYDGAFYAMGGVFAAGAVIFLLSELAGKRRKKAS